METIKLVELQETTKTFYRLVSSNTSDYTKDNSIDSYDTVEEALRRLNSRLANGLYKFNKIEQVEIKQYIL